MQLPMPTRGALGKAEIASAIVADALAALAIPGGATASKTLERLLNRRLQQAQDELFDAISRGEYGLLSSPDYENLVPNALTYFEAARRGEYEHNLKVLAALLAGEFRVSEADPGKIRRAARRLEAMSQEELEFLVVLKKVYDKKEKSEGFDGHHLCIEDRDVVDYFGREYKSPETEINSRLIDFISRGLLFIGSNPGYIGGQYYYKTEAFNEIVAAAEKAEA